MASETDKNGPARDSRGRFARGSTGGPGRSKQGNIGLDDLMFCMLRALKKAGGETYLVRLAKQHPGRFMSMLARLLPTNAEATRLLFRDASRKQELTMRESMEMLLVGEDFNALMDLDRQREEIIAAARERFEQRKHPA